MCGLGHGLPATASVAGNQGSVSHILHSADMRSADSAAYLWPRRTVVAEAGEIGCIEEEAALSLRQLRVKGQSRDGEQDFVDSQSSELELGQLGLGLDSSTADVVDLSSDADSTRQAGMPMIPYPKEYCKHCGEMAFCHRASNPGCGGYATGGVASFNNRIRAQGCTIGPVLTVPRSYVRDISGLAKTPGGFETLVQMLQSGFRLYEGKGHSGPVWQCIHAPRHVSVRWLHLHTFCLEGKVDNLPTHHDYCAKMSSFSQAAGIASSWLR